MARRDAGDPAGRRLPALRRRLQGRGARGHAARAAPFGPRLRALAIHLRYARNIAFGRLARLFRDLYGLRISEGALINMPGTAGSAFAAQSGRLRSRLLASPVLASDETSLRVAGRNHWLWVVHHADSAVFMADPTRAKRVLGDFPGGRRPDFWLSNRCGGQRGFAAKGQQFCLAHLIRDARYAREAGDDGFAPGLIALFRRACRLGRARDRFTSRRLAACRRKFVKAAQAASCSGRRPTPGASGCAASSPGSGATSLSSSPSTP